MKYDPDRAPEANSWLSLDEDERMSLVVQYHKHAREELPNPRLHAVVHVIIENQLAEGIPVVQQALVKLIGEGLDRHEALHAIGSVLAEHIFYQMKGKAQSLDPNDPYFKDVSLLTADSWRKQTR